MSSAELIIKEVALLPTYLPAVGSLKDMLKKARDWISRLEMLQKLEYSPYLEALESLMTKAKPIAIKLDSLDELDNQIAAGHAWRERTAKTFLRKNSYYSLIEVLSPKLDILGKFLSDYQLSSWLILNMLFIYFFKGILVSVAGDPKRTHSIQLTSIT